MAMITKPRIRISLKGNTKDKVEKRARKLQDFCRRRALELSSALAKETTNNNEIAAKIGEYGCYITKTGVPDIQVVVYTDMLQAWANALRHSDRKIGELRGKLLKFKQYERSYKEALYKINVEKGDENGTDEK